MDWFGHFIESYYSLSYVIVFFATIIEGDITLLVLGALTKERYLSFLKVFFIGCAAAVVHDIIFWHVGVRLKRLKRKKYLFVDLEKINEALERIRPVIGASIVLSKFAWNFNRVVLVSSGYVGVPFRRLIKLSIPAAFLWVLSYLSLGYVFADQTDLFKQRIEYVGLLVMGIILAVVLFELYLKKLAQKYFYNALGILNGSYSKQTESCRLSNKQNDSKESGFIEK